MLWLKKHLNQAARERVHQAVVAAEKRTPAEIVPVLVRRSVRSHAAALAGLILLALLWGCGQSIGRLYLPWGHWGARPVDVALCLLAGWSLASTARVRRWLTRPSDRRRAVHLAAEASFYRLGLHKAEHDNGVLIFVSLEERQAVVLAGPGIAAKVEPHEWDSICKRLVRQAANEDLGAGFETAILASAELLEKHFPHPRGKRRKNKLADRLRILHEVV
jgi:putative membrane protein